MFSGCENLEKKDILSIKFYGSMADCMLLTFFNDLRKRK